MKKILALWSSKIHKYESLTGEKKLHFDEKQIKTTVDPGENQVWALEIIEPAEQQKLKSTEDILPKDEQNNEI